MSSNANSQDYKTKRLVVTAMMICLIVLGTLLFRIPIPMTHGYIHLGDAMIYLGILLLGRKSGAVAASLGSALGDVLGGYAFWAPWTIIIKFAMAWLSGFIIDRRASHHEPGSRGLTMLYISAMAAGGIVMCAGYLVAERTMYGIWSTALIGLPWNIGQFIGGIIVALALNQGMSRIPYIKRLLS